MPFYLTPKQDDFNQELRVGLATARVRQRLLLRSEGGLLGLAGAGGCPGLEEQPLITPAGLFIF